MTKPVFLGLIIVLGLTSAAKSGPNSNFRMVSGSDIIIAEAASAVLRDQGRDIRDYNIIISVRDGKNIVTFQHKDRSVYRALDKYPVYEVRLNNDLSIIDWVRPK